MCDGLGCKFDDGPKGFGAQSGMRVSRSCECVARGTRKCPGDKRGNREVDSGLEGPGNYVWTEGRVRMGLVNV